MVKDFFKAMAEASGLNPSDVAEVNIKRHRNGSVTVIFEVILNSEMADILAGEKATAEKL